MALPTCECVKGLPLGEKLDAIYCATLNVVEEGGGAAFLQKSENLADVDNAAAALANIGGATPSYVNSQIAAAAVNIPGHVWVNLTTGNDATGQPGNPNKPYADPTVAANAVYARDGAVWLHLTSPTPYPLLNLNGITAPVVIQGDGGLGYQFLGPTAISVTSDDGVGGGTDFIVECAGGVALETVACLAGSAAIANAMVSVSMVAVNGGVVLATNCLFRNLFGVSITSDGSSVFLRNCTGDVSSVAANGATGGAIDMQYCNFPAANIDASGSSSGGSIAMTMCNIASIANSLAFPATVTKAGNVIGGVFSAA